MLQSWQKKGQQILQKGFKTSLHTIFSSLLWKEIATIWYSDSHSNNVWQIIFFIFCFCFIYPSFIFCLSLKFNNSHIILHSTLQNQSNQHLQSISLFAVRCCESPSLCLCGGAGLPCRSNQRYLAHQQWISIAVICSVRTTTIPSNAKQFLMGMRHWYTTCLKAT